jgi:hypothetical protein
MTNNQSSKTPHLLDSSTFSSEQSKDFGDFRFDSKRSAAFPIQFSNGDCTVEAADSFEISWSPVKTKARLHSGKWFFEFHIETMENGQIGVGFLLDWNVGPDWGFFGYLGASSTAWSYDPCTGDIVSATESIHGQLPKMNGKNGIIGLELDLPRDRIGNFTFIVDGVRTPTKELPNAGAVAIPAVCLLSRKQKVTIRNLTRIY